MLYLIIGVIILILVIVMLSLFFCYKNKLTNYNIKVNEADNNLDLYLEKKIELLIKISNILKDSKIEDVPDVGYLKGKKTSHYELYSTLTKLSEDILKIADVEEKKIKDKKFNTLVDKLEENECDLRAAIKFYNDNAIEINHYVHKFPSNLVAFFTKNKELELYKIRKRELFEILKNK